MQLIRLFPIVNRKKYGSDVPSFFATFGQQVGDEADVILFSSARVKCLKDRNKL